MDRRTLLLVGAAVVAALGVALVFVYARGAEARAADKYETVQVLTASQRIEPGESLDDALEGGKVQLSEVVRAQALEGADDDSDPLRGKVALTTIYPGEQLVPVKFGAVEDVDAAAVLPIPKGKVAISVLVSDDGRVGRFIKTGAEVSVIATILEGSEPLFTRMLLPRVTVLADGLKTFVPDEESPGEAAGEDQEIQRLVTLALNQEEAEKVRFAEKDGELTIALLNDASKVKVGPEVNRDNLFD